MTDPQNTRAGFARLIQLWTIQLGCDPSRRGRGDVLTQRLAVHVQARGHFAQRPFARTEADGKAERLAVVDMIGILQHWYAGRSHWRMRLCLKPVKTG